MTGAEKEEELRRKEEERKQEVAKSITKMEEDIIEGEFDVYLTFDNNFFSFLKKQMSERNYQLELPKE